MAESRKPEGKWGGLGRASRMFLKENPVHLLPEKAIWLPDESWLVLSDLHLGKVNHFRRAGIPVPVGANRANTERLLQLLMEFHPARVVFLGDLFHSHYNSEWEVLGQVTGAFPEVTFTLVTGNHDILSAHQYDRHRIEVVPELRLGSSLIFRHEPSPADDAGAYQVCGHLHPAVTVSGKGMPSETFPCFWIGNKIAVLPSFGVFTGSKRIVPRRGDRVFAVVAGELVELSAEV